MLFWRVFGYIKPSKKHSELGVLVYMYVFLLGALGTSRAVSLEWQDVKRGSSDGFGEPELPGKGVSDVRHGPVGSFFPRLLEASCGPASGEGNTLGITNQQTIKNDRTNTENHQKLHKLT